MNQLAEADSRSMRKFLVAVLVLVAAFSVPLYQLVRFALHSELYSYILLIPVVSAYLAWIVRDELSPAGPAVSRAWAAAALTIGLGFLIWYLLMVFSPGPAAARQDKLAVAMYALTALIIGFACLFFGRSTLQRLGFPLGFLVWLAPFPIFVEAALEYFLQHGSSIVASALLQMAGMPVIRDDTYFRLPGFNMQVAPECSGIHSTLALFITSLVAGQVLLRGTWQRITLAAVVLPIALLRNGFRVAVIGELCVRISPDMINSWIHRKGGPVFFVLSLIPFSLILFYLLKSERPKGSAAPTAKLS